MHSDDYTPASLAAFLRSAEFISAEALHRWMQSPNLEILGVTYDAISELQILVKISPPLTDDHVQKFLQHYFQRCLVEDEQGDWCDSRYTASWDCANWLKAKWRQLSGEQRADWKVWLSTLYARGDAALRQAIETGLLEHMFADREIAKYFQDWRDDATLGEAYRLARSVAVGGLFKGRRKLL